MGYMDHTETQLLPGGFVTTVVRIGDTVRRVPPPNAGFVHRLLRYLEQQGWAGAPRFLGLDEQRQEMLGFLPGHVAWEATQPPEVGCEASLAGAARLVRVVADAYDLADRSTLVETILWWQDRCWRGIEAAARTETLR